MAIHSNHELVKEEMDKRVKAIHNGFQSLEDSRYGFVNVGTCVKNYIAAYSYIHKKLETEESNEDMVKDFIALMNVHKELIRQCGHFKLINDIVQDKLPTKQIYALFDVTGVYQELRDYNDEEEEDRKKYLIDGIKEQLEHQKVNGVIKVLKEIK